EKLVGLSEQPVRAAGGRDVRAGVVAQLFEGMSGGGRDSVVAPAVGKERGDGDTPGALAQVMGSSNADLVKKIPGVEDRSVRDVEPTPKREPPFNDTVEKTTQEDGEYGPGNTDRSAENEAAKK